MLAHAIATPRAPLLEDLEARTRTLGYEWLQEWTGLDERLRQWDDAAHELTPGQLVLLGERFRPRPNSDGMDVIPSHVIYNELRGAGQLRAQRMANASRRRERVADRYEIAPRFDRRLLEPTPEDAGRCIGDLELSFGTNGERFRLDQILVQALAFGAYRLEADAPLQQLANAYRSGAWLWNARVVYQSSGRRRNLRNLPQVPGPRIQILHDVVVHTR